jgi:hypothetical protein
MMRMLAYLDHVVRRKSVEVIVDVVGAFEAVGNDRRDCGNFVTGERNMENLDPA